MAQRDRYTTPLCIALLGAVALTAVWGILNARLIARSGELADPSRTGPITVRVRTGDNWTASTIRRWWGDAAHLGIGWEGPVIRDAAGNRLFHMAPGTMEDAHLMSTAAALGSPITIQHRAVGWPWRVWSSATYRDAKSTVLLREKRPHWPALMLSVLTIFTASFASLFSASLLVRQTCRSALTARRSALNRCPTCGYNLVATPAACPECGWTRPEPPSF